MQAMSTQSGLGDAYVYLHIDKDYLDGKKLRVYWQWYLDRSGTSHTLNQLYVVDHEHDRKLINSGEFRTQSDAEHPVTDYTYITACSYTATCNGGWVGWRSDTSGVLDLSGFSSDVVSVMIKNVDPWVAYTAGLQVYYVQVLDSGNNVLKDYRFTGNVFMEETGTYYDYGLIREPNMISWGTTDYPNASGGADELNLSGNVSEYVCGLFDSTGVYDVEDNWGASTQPGTVYSSIEDSEADYDYSVILYKGHFWQASSPGDCGTYGCDIYHWGVADNEGYTGGTWEFIKDYNVYSSVVDGKDDADKTRGTHDFIFLWSCLEGDSSRAGEISGSHSWGMLASWMDIDDPNSQLEDYGYADPDDRDHVFMSFSWISPCYLYYGQAPDRYLSQFLYQFFNYALQGITVNDALDDASEFINGFGVSFGSSDLYNNQLVWNPQTDEWDYTQMRVWGDGDHVMPG
ncbi:MAG: hypothetical protein NWF04_09785 [Candidatus Bathyarchaeota archaeon]|nr:hypothetical protein [Candidatus Bathyarchaeota archaeon]